jgi:hypothetical protein
MNTEFEVVGNRRITWYIWLISFAQLFAPFHSAKTSDIPEPTLYAIRKPAFGKGDRKFMTLLPSFNEKGEIKYD